MKWFSVYKDGTPNDGQRVLTYSAIYKDQPEMAFRLMDSQFVRLCTEVTHYIYLWKLIPQEDKDDTHTE
jgi:hypothetical protein